VTYGAGGSTRQRTHDTVVRLKKETGIDPAAHLTCVGATRGEIDDIARAYWDAGIRHIVALRGDPPAGMGAKYTAHPGGYANAAELVAGLKKIGDFQISVAGYPEKHPIRPTTRPTSRTQAQGRCRRRPLHHPVLLRADDFLRFRDRAATVGVNVPVVPGIMPVSNFQGSPRWPACAAPRCRRGLPACSTASTRTSRRGA
jgi:5,10-methylenetetrahydrofolate reductase